MLDFRHRYFKVCRNQFSLPLKQGEVSLTKEATEGINKEKDLKKSF